MDFFRLQLWTAAVGTLHRDTNRNWRLSPVMMDEVTAITPSESAVLAKSFLSPRSSSAPTSLRLENQVGYRQSTLQLASMLPSSLYHHVLHFWEHESMSRMRRKKIQIFWQWQWTHMSLVSGFTHVLKSHVQHCFSVKKALERVLVFQGEENIDKITGYLSGQQTQLNQ